MSLPWHTEMEFRLHDHEVYEYPEDRCGGGDHDYEPEVQLGFWPHVSSFALEAPDDGFVGHGLYGWALDKVGWMRSW